MDESRFDDLSRRLAGRPTRRAALGLLAALGLAAGSAEDADARGCAPRCKPCRRCVRGRCRAANDPSRCADGEVCFRGACCPPDCAGKTCGPDGCGGSCGSCVADTAGDGRTDAEACVDGRCVVWRGDCPAGADSCAAGGAVGCNGNALCSCYRSFAGGTRCGRTSNGAGPCGECAADADCGGGGAFCAVDGPSCPCDEAQGEARCIQPC